MFRMSCWSEEAGLDRKSVSGKSNSVSGKRELINDSPSGIHDTGGLL